MSEVMDVSRRPACGPIVGAARNGVARFLGIPFAKAPRGPGRFLAPQPPEPWSAPRRCDSYGPTAPQLPRAFTLIPEPLGDGADYLNLNIFAPAQTPDKPLPVLVYFHGGGYWAGCNRSPWFEGDSFALNGVITVVPSYRLGIEGFLPIDGAPDNRALLDWIAALEWVRDNIAAFDGDPEQVTIAGQSAGGGAVANLIAAPKAKGLFRRAAMFSGNIGFRGNAARMEEFSGRFARALGHRPDLELLGALSTSEILDAHARAKALQPDTRPGEAIFSNARDGIALQPIPGLTGLPQAPEIAMAQGAGQDIPMLLTCTRDEFVFEFEPFYDKIDMPYLVAACSGFGVDLTDAMDTYPEHGMARLFGQLVSDRVFRAPMLDVADIRGIRSCAPTYVAEFRRDGGTRHKSPLRASHCLDMPYYFNRLSAESVQQLCGRDAPQSLADRMHGTLVDFVKGGKMNLTDWSNTGTARLWNDVTCEDGGALGEELAYMRSRPDRLKTMRPEPTMARS